MGLFNKKQYKISEEIDANGDTLFYPVEKSNYFSRNWEKMQDLARNANFRFSSYNEANEWMCSRIYDDNTRIVVKRISHKVDPVFNALQKKAVVDDAANSETTRPDW